MIFPVRRSGLEDHTCHNSVVMSERTHYNKFRCGLFELSLISTLVSARQNKSSIILCNDAAQLLIEGQNSLSKQFHGF